MAPGRERVPPREQVLSQRANSGERLVIEGAAHGAHEIDTCSMPMLDPLGRGGQCPAGALDIEEANEMFDSDGFARQLSTRPPPLRVRDVPAFGHESEESLATLERRLDGVMREIMPGNEFGVTRALSLPRR